MKAVNVQSLRDAFRSARICYAIDLKMMLVMLGLLSSGARFACPFCLFSRWKKHSCPHTKRSILGLTSEATALQDMFADEERSFAKPGEHGSSSGMPPMSCLALADDILPSMPPGTLHVMLGVVATVIDEIERCDNEMCASFLRELGVRRNEAHAGTDFVGPECKKILEKVDKLVEKTSSAARTKFEHSREGSTPEQRRTRANPPPDPHEPKMCVPRRVIDRHVRVLQCCSALSNFHDVMRMTKAGANIDAFEEATVGFCADIAELQLKTTMKIHIVDDHLSTFVKSMPSGFSLAAYSEQAMETCHYHHELVTRRCNVPKKFRKPAPERVKRSVDLWNSGRISFAEYERLKASRVANV